MPKKLKDPVPRPSIPVPARVQEDEDFRPLTVSLEGKILEAGGSYACGWRWMPSTRSMLWPPW